MKRCIIAMGLVSLLAAPTVFAHEQSILARVTVYWASGGGGSDHWTRNHQAATSVRLRAGHCAVDPKRIPYGSRVILNDGTLVAVDTGKHVVSRRAARKAGRTAAERNAIVIDRFFETKSQALAWTRRNPHFMTVRVISPNDSSRTTRVATKPVTPKAKQIAYAAPAPSVATRATSARSVAAKLPQRLAYQPPQPTAVASSIHPPSHYSRPVAYLP